VGWAQWRPKKIDLDAAMDAREGRREPSNGFSDKHFELKKTVLIFPAMISLEKPANPRLTVYIFNSGDGPAKAVFYDKKVPSSVPEIVEDVRKLKVFSHSVMAARRPSLTP
jgi:hypothetical protein